MAQTGTTTAALNIRTGAGTSNSVLGVIPKGAAVMVTGPAQNGWYPVTYGSISGWSKASYFNPLSSSPTTPPPTPTTPSNPTGLATSNNPFYQGGSAPYGSAIGSQVDTSLVKDKATWGQEFESFLTKTGFGGIGRTADVARGLGDRMQAGYQAATMNNPGLTSRAFMNDHLGGNFIRDSLARMTPGQRNEQTAIKNPVVNKTPR